MPKKIDDHKVYEAAIATIIEHGYSGATTKLIAEAAEINEVTLFRRYGSKAQLVADAVAHAEFAFDMGDIRYTGDLHSDLMQILTGYQRSQEIHGRLFPIIMAEMSRHSDLQETIQGPTNVIQKIGNLLIRYQQEGMLEEEHPLQAVGALVGPLIINSMIRQAGIEKTLPPIDLETHVQRYINGRKQRR